MPDSQVVSIKILIEGRRTGRLLDCLRENLTDVAVGVAEAGDLALVTGIRAGLADVHELLDQRLDECAEALGIADRVEYLVVDRGEVGDAHPAD